MRPIHYLCSIPWNFISFNYNHTARSEIYRYVWQICMSHVCSN
jgi:hypothetical protein